MMTKKHYVAIAEVINKSFKGHGLTIPVNVRDNLLSGLVDCFEKDNPPFKQHFKKYGFDKNRFLEACGVEK